MTIVQYKRHTDECREKHGWVHSAACQAANEGKKQKGCDCPTPDKNYRRCDCPIWFEENDKGKQRRWSSKESEWSSAEERLREYKQAQAKGEPRPSYGSKTLEDAVTDFLENKRIKTTRRGTVVCADTIYRHEAVLESLKAFCTGQQIRLLKDITLLHIEKWQCTWKLKSLFAKRSRQEKVRNFFRYCVNHRFIAENPLTHWESVPLMNDDDSSIPEERIIRDKEYAKILQSVDGTPMTAENRIRVKACMRLQRESGLAIVDAVTLHKTELAEESGKYRITTKRQKTGTNINVPITSELGRFLLTVKNGNPEYFFWSGSTLPEDAPSYFQKLYRRVFKKAGLDHSSHDFRHTYAAYFLEAGGDIRRLSKALGHSSVKVTEKFYAHFTGKQQDLLDEDAERALASASLEIR